MIWHPFSQKSYLCGAKVNMQFLLAIFAPEVEVGVFLREAIYYGSLFQARAALSDLTIYGC